MLDRFTSLQVFARVAALGSLSAAARALSMSQTMATKHMAALETRLGVRLVNRSTRRLTLTEAGRGYLDAIEGILADLDEADADVARETVEVRGTLRLSVPVSYGMIAIAPLLPELVRAHPALTVDLGLNDRHVDLVEEGWDLAIRIGTMPDSALIARKLAPCPMVLAASPDYLVRRGTPRTLAELSGHDGLAYTLSRAMSAERWAFGRDGREVVQVKAVLKANNGDVLVAAAVAGLGIIYQPSFLVEAPLARGQLVPIELDVPATALSGVFAVYASARRPPAKVRAAVDFFARRLSGR